MDLNATYIDHMGSDLSVVNAARVSFGKKSEWEFVCNGCGSKKDRSNCQGLSCIFKQKLSEADQGLISFLARGCTTGEWEALVADVAAWGRLFSEAGVGGVSLEEVLHFIRHMPPHWSPFGHTAITVHVKAPIFVARQLGKHQVGFVWNEISRRYVDGEPEFFIPEKWNGRAANAKQGADYTINRTWAADQCMMVETEYDYYGDGTGYTHYYQIAKDVYSQMLKSGVAPEQARMILPQSMYTEWYWTGNLFGFANMFNQRTDTHAQLETQLVANQIGDIIAPLFPVSWKALTNNKKQDTIDIQVHD